jgi:raffinose/stachyose/melibiose transport system permease protein
VKKHLRSFSPAAIASYAIFSLFAFLALFPLFWMLNNSLKTNAEIFKDVFALPSGLRFDNYREAWRDGRLGRLFLNSVFYTSASTAFIVLLSAMMAYAFAKTRFKRTSAVLYAVLGLGILVSLQAILIPLFITIRALGLQNSYMGIILTYVATGLPIATYLATEYMRGIPDALIESARMDGAGHFLIFLAVVAPTAVPVLTTIAILNVLGVWNEFMLVLVLGNDRTNSIAVGVYSFASTTSQRYDKQMAALVIATLPVVLLYATLNKLIARGVVAGAVKG